MESSREKIMGSEEGLYGFRLWEIKNFNIP